MTTLGLIFAAPFSAARLFAVRFFAARLFVAPLGVSKSKLICIVKGSLAMGKHSKKPFSLHLSMILKHKALNL